MKNKYRLKLNYIKKDVKQRRNNIIRFRNNPIYYDHNDSILEVVLGDDYCLYFINPDLFFAINEYRWATKYWHICKKMSERK